MKGEPEGDTSLCERCVGRMYLPCQQSRVAKKIVWLSGFLKSTGSPSIPHTSCTDECTAPQVALAHIFCFPRQVTEGSFLPCRDLGWLGCIVWR